MGLYLQVESRFPFIGSENLSNFEITARVSLLLSRKFLRLAEMSKIRIGPQMTNGKEGTEVAASVIVLHQFPRTSRSKFTNKSKSFVT